MTTVLVGMVALEQDV